MAAERDQQRRGASGTGGARKSDRMSADPNRAGSKPGQQGLSRPGVMGDETEEQNLNQPGDPSARISREDVEAAFSGNKPAASTGGAARKDDELDPEQPE
jgi:hypothetical protein